MPQIPIIGRSKTERSDMDTKKKLSEAAVSSIQENRFEKILHLFMRWAGLALGIYVICTGLFGTPDSRFHRPLVLGVILFFIFIERNYKGENTVHTSWYDYIIAVLSLAGCLFLAFCATKYSKRILFISPVSTMDLIVSLFVTLAVIEAARRLTGWALPVICIVLLIYTLFGDKFKGTLHHYPFSLKNIAEQMAMGTNGIFGSATHTGVTTVAMFIIFGSVMSVTGTGDLFMDIANSVCGRFSGAPAKTSVVSSALMGMISGNSTANVVTTGAFTIPAMKKAGFEPEYAGAVEAVASSGGQIMPPIMGAAAFLMADFTGVPYSKIVIYAIIPAFLYYLAVMLQVHFRAKKLGMKGLPPSEIPSLWKTIKARGVFILPVVGLIAMLMMGYTPMRAGFIAIVSNIALGFLFLKNRRATLQKLICELQSIPEKLFTVLAATAAAGIIIGTLYMTGITNRISSILIALAGGRLLLGLVLAMFLAIVLGMGMPTSGAYIVMSTLVAPGLIEMGLSVVQAHMFVMYFACMSAVTPPVALASYAGAAVAEADPGKVGFIAWKLALTAFIIPYMFAYGADLLMLNGFLQSLLPTITAAIGCLGLSICIEGHLVIKANTIQRVLSMMAAFLLIDTNGWTDAVGIALMVIVVTWQLVGKKKAQAI